LSSANPLDNPHYWTYNVTYGHAGAQARRVRAQHASKQSAARDAATWARDNDVVGCVVQFVNKVSVDYGTGVRILDLPDGVKGDSNTCPIANALSYVLEYPIEVDGSDTIDLTGYLGSDTTIEAPRCVRAFVDLFDKGRYPLYVAPDEDDWADDDMEDYDG
jgi:hypothetical protein